MALYLGATHRRHRPAGAHRKPTRWDQMKGWIRAPRHKKGPR